MHCEFIVLSMIDPLLLPDDTLIIYPQSMDYRTRHHDFSISLASIELNGFLIGGTEIVASTSESQSCFFSLELDPNLSIEHIEKSAITDLNDSQPDTRNCNIKYQQ